MEKNKLDPQDYGISEVLRLGIYPYFVKNKRGKRLLDIYNTRLITLEKKWSIKTTVREV